MMILEININNDELLMYKCIDLTMRWYVGVVIYYIMMWII